MIFLNKRMVMRILMLIGFASNLHFFVFAQNSTKKEIKPPDFQDFKSESKLMKREMPYRVIFPPDYFKKTNEKFAVIFLIHGLTGHFTDWTKNTRIADYAKKYNYLIVMPEGGNGWYSDSAKIEDDKYESYLIRELIPEIEKKFRVLPGKKSRAIAGPSMGGYGALKFGLKYPQMFAVAGSFSGALGAAIWNRRDLGKTGILSNTIMNTFGESNSQTRKSNEIFKMVKAILPENTGILPFFYLDCGTEDFLITMNKDFSNLLFTKKIPHEFRMFPGNHDWKIWDYQIVEFLDLSLKYVINSEKK